MMNYKILLFFTLVIASCKPSKITQSTNEATLGYSAIKNDTTTKQTISTKKKKDTTYTTITTFEPINANETMCINGVEYKNIRFKTINIRKGTSISKDKNVSLNRRKQETNTINITKKKTTTIKERKGRLMWGLSLSLLLLIVGFIIYKKIRG